MVERGFEATGQMKAAELQELSDLFSADVGGEMGLDIINEAGVLEFWKAAQSNCHHQTLSFAASTAPASPSRITILARYTGV